MYIISGIFKLYLISDCNVHNINNDQYSYLQRLLSDIIYGIWWSPLVIRRNTQDKRFGKTIRIVLKIELYTLTKSCCVPSYATNNAPHAGKHLIKVGPRPLYKAFGPIKNDKWKRCVTCLIFQIAHIKL